MDKIARAERNEEGLRQADISGEPFLMEQDSRVVEAQDNFDGIVQTSSFKKKWQVMKQYEAEQDKYRLVRFNAGDEKNSDKNAGPTPRSRRGKNFDAEKDKKIVTSMEFLKKKYNYFPSLINQRQTQVKQK